MKVEPDLFYRACDELGLLVIQDMPSLHIDGDKPPNAQQMTEFERQLTTLINEHKSYTCIGIWVCSTLVTGVIGSLILNVAGDLEVNAK